VGAQEDVARLPRRPRQDEGEDAASSFRVKLVWISGPMDKWISGPMDYVIVDKWTSPLAGLWVSEPRDRQRAAFQNTNQTTTTHTRAHHPPPLSTCLICFCFAL
jgi:hypothetical protein